MELIKQRFTYSIIDIIRDNCVLNSERVNEKKPVILSDDFDLPFESVEPSIDMILNQVQTSEAIRKKSPSYVDIKLEPFPKNGKRTKYFYNNTQKEYVSFQKLTKEPCYTSKEKHLKRHYGNPFASIRIVTTERSIQIRDNKLHIRLYQNIRRREFNWRYFRKSSDVKTFTIDLEKGDFTIGDMLFGTTKKKVFRKNSFSTLELLLNSNYIFNIKSRIDKNLKVADEFSNVFNDYEFLKIIKEYIKDLPSECSDLTHKHQFTNKFIEFFVEKKKIKTPNNFTDLIKLYYPTEKFLKKNERKLVQSILDSFGINSKFVSKLFHSNPRLHLQEFSSFCSLFGKDYPKYLGSLHPDFLKFFSYKSGTTVTSVPLELRGPHSSVRQLYIDKNEKENIIKIVNSLITPSDQNRAQQNTIQGLYTLFKDHFDMIEKIRDYDPNIKMRATNYSDFHIEHLELSKMCSLIKKGWSIEYQYDNRMVRLVQEVIKTSFEDNEYTFNPTILKREEEYSEEGSFMHHCVATYANKESSMIVSLRSADNTDRVTCEFNKKTGDCIQERYFCNKLPPVYFIDSLEILKKRIKKFATQRLLNHIDVKKVKIKINGKEVPERAEMDLFDQLIYGINDANF